VAFEVVTRVILRVAAARVGGEGHVDPDRHRPILEMRSSCHQRVRSTDRHGAGPSWRCHFGSMPVKVSGARSPVSPAGSLLSAIPHVPPAR